jgi:hypothetical protein
MATRAPQSLYAPRKALRNVEAPEEQNAHDAVNQIAKPAHPVWLREWQVNRHQRSPPPAPRALRNASLMPEPT